MKRKLFWKCNIVGILLLMLLLLLDPCLSIQANIHNNKYDFLIISPSEFMSPLIAVPARIWLAIFILFSVSYGFAMSIYFFQTSLPI